MAARKRRHDAYGLAVTLLAASGCMISPDYARPPAPTARRWIEAEHAALRTESADTPRWWEVFGDPVLGWLVAIAHAENLTLRAAGLRVLQAQARRGVAIGGLFPQTQQLSGSYTRTRLAGGARPRPRLLPGRLRCGLGDRSLGQVPPGDRGGRRRAARRGRRLRRRAGEPRRRGSGYVCADPCPR